MSGRATFDWQMEEEQDGKTVPTTGAPEAKRSSKSFERWLIWLASGLLVGVMLFWGGQRLVQRAEANLDAVEAELAEAIVLEEWTNQNRRPARDRPALASEQSAAVADSLQNIIGGTSLQNFELDENYARAQLFVAEPSRPWHSEPYYVTEVFRHDASGWTATAPISMLWGERRTTETTYFRLDYGVEDAATIAEVVPSLDALYLRLYREMGLVPPRNRQIEIRIDVVGGTNFDVTDLRSSGSAIIVPPPELMERPASVSLAAALYDAIAFPLSVRVFNESIEQYIVPCHWNSLTQGIGEWQRWSEHRLPSRRYWNRQTAFWAWLDEEGMPTLAELSSVAENCWHRPPYFDPLVPIDGEYAPRIELAETLVGFAVEQHSRRIVPELLRALVRHKDWSTLAPDVFDMEEAELEAAWHEYVREQQLLTTTQ